MKILSTAAALVVLLSPLSASARAVSFFNAQSPIVSEGLPVKGENPLEYCSNPNSNILEIDSVDLSPNPPQAGTVLTIQAKGTLNERVEKGAKVLVEVKYGLITLINQSIDLCEQLGNVDLECPLEKGDLVLTKEVELPKAIPPGTYNVHADVLTHDDKRITCLDAHNIKFNVGR